MERPAATVAQEAARSELLAIENLAIRWVLDQPPIERDDLLDELVGSYLLS